MMNPHHNKAETKTGTKGNSQSTGLAVCEQTEQSLSGGSRKDFHVYREAEQTEYGNMGIWVMFHLEVKDPVRDVSFRFVAMT